MRFITFQSKIVFDILKDKGIYYADRSLMREDSLCQEDIDVCNGRVPIWVFAHPYLTTHVNIHPQLWEDFFATCQGEMSLPFNRDKGLSQLLMFELDLNYLPPQGLAHNSCSMCRVIDKISISDVKAVYTVDYVYHKDECELAFYLYKLEPLFINNWDILFPMGFSCTEDQYNEDVKDPIKFYSIEDYYDLGKN